MAEDQSADIKRRQYFAVVARRKKEQAAKEAGRTDDQRRDAARKTENRKQAEAKRDNGRKADRQRKEYQLKESLLKAAQQKDQRSRQADRVAAAYVQQRHRAEREDQRSEHRRQTDQTRVHHRVEKQTHRANDSAALNDHWHGLRRIDESERIDLAQWDKSRNSFRGRFNRAVRGNQGFERQREKIVAHHEARRMALHRQLEAFKERQFTKAQDMWLRQARERMDMKTAHRDATVRLAMDQQRGQSREIKQRAQAIDNARKQDQARRHEHAQEQAREKSTGRAFSEAARGLSR